MPAASASSSASRRDLLTDLVGLGLLTALLADVLPPALVALPTWAAGGDTPCHLPTAQWLWHELLPAGRLHGWWPGNLAGHPLPLYYFPLPFLLVAALASGLGLPVAFKLVLVGGAALLPFGAYAALRLMGFACPTPLVGAAAALVFLFVPDNPIWGGTLASTLVGEFCYAWGAVLALLFLGLVYRDYSRGRSGRTAAVALALVALTHGYTLLWAGAAASGLMVGSRRPAHTLGWLLRLAGLAFGLAGFFLVPLLAAWRYTTPYDDPWLEVSWSRLWPAALLPVGLLALFGLAASLLVGRAAGGLDRRVSFWLMAVAAALVLALAAPGFGLIDVRLVPLAQMALAPLAAAGGEAWLRRRAWPRAWGLALVVGAVAWCQAHSGLVRAWARWDLTGLESKPGWPALRALADDLRGGIDQPRVAVEYGAEREQAGTLRAPELLPALAGRATLEGVYNQASLQSPAVYYLLSELSPVAPNPFRKREYASFDPIAALAHLRLLHVGQVVSTGPVLRRVLADSPHFALQSELPPYAVFDVARVEPGASDGGVGLGDGYVVPLSCAPVRAAARDLAAFRDESYRWLTRRPAARALLVYGPAPFAQAVADPWLAPPEQPLPGAAQVRVEAELRAEEILVRTNRPGHPLLVKVSFHPRWRVEGGEGPYLVSPALMLVVPRGPSLRLFYVARDTSDAVGLALAGASLAGLALWAWVPYWRRRRGGQSPRPRPFRPRRVGPDGLPLPPRRWGALVPLGAALLLLAPRGLGRGPANEVVARELKERAERALGAGRALDAAEYARQGLSRLGAWPAGADRGREQAEVRAALWTLRAQALDAGGEAQAAGAAWRATLEACTASEPAAAEVLSSCARRARRALAQAARDALSPASPAPPGAFSDPPR